ncbi:hypothetical protein ACFX2K_009799 [Malus domestica]|nr:ATP-dependent zinc metalloprotease FTSH 10, mitochondrial-like [Malus domestica]
MVFSSIRRSITHSARSKLNRNVISGSYNWRNTLRHDSFPPSLTPLGNACVDGCVGILRGYIAYNGAGKQLLSKAYMSNLKSVLGIPRIRRLFSSQGPGKKTLRKLLSEKQEGNSERGRTEISVQRGIRCRWSGEYSGTVFEADSRFIAPLMFIGFIVTSLFLNPHQTKEISFQENKTCKDCKVIPGESVANQHRLLVMDVHIKRGRQKNKTWKCPRTRWWNLKEEKQAIFKEKLIPKVYDAFCL